MLSFILRIIGMFFIVMIASVLLKQYVFPKLKVNKWIVLGITVVVLVVPIVLSQTTGFKLTSIFTFIQASVVAILFLWFLDVAGWTPKPTPPKSKKPKYTAPEVIKAKAKPNRLKNTDMEVIDIKDIKAKKNKKNKKK